MPNPKSVPSFAFITTCKGRLHHLKKTLPLLVAQAPAQIIVVDYECPDHAGDWVEANFPSVQVVRVSDDPGFCLPRARNIGAAHAKAPWLGFIDADIQVADGWLHWLGENVQAHTLYRAGSTTGEPDPQIYGTVVCSQADFQAIDGYDEVFRGWGGEDDDLYLRLCEVTKADTERFPDHFLTPIDHVNDERTTFHPIKSVKTQLLINRCYIQAKAYLYALGFSAPSMAVRKQLMGRIVENLRERPKTFSFRVQLDGLNHGGHGHPVQLKIVRRRRFGLFGAKHTRVQLLNAPGDHRNLP